MLLESRTLKSSCWLGHTLSELEVLWEDPPLPLTVFGASWQTFVSVVYRCISLVSASIYTWPVCLGVCVQISLFL